MFLDHASGDTAPPEGCADPTASLRQMFVGMVQAGRIAQGQCPAMRAVFLKPHGVARATFTVRDDVPEELRVGVLAGGTYEAWVRLSSDTVPTAPDLKTTCGIGIKLFGVPGPKLLEPEATTQDFLLQNIDVFFVDTAKDMCEFTYAGVVEHDYDSYLAAHPETARILDEMAKVVPSTLTTSYWSGVPYALGDSFAKYVLVPTGCAEPTVPVDESDPYYLHTDLRSRLLAAEATFDFCVQPQTDPETEPIDRATVPWTSTPVPVATLTLHRQDIDSRGQAAYGENLAFNPWHSLADHAPAGSINDARRVVYEASSELRRDVNGVPIGEPVTSRPVVDDTPAVDSVIVRAAIHPALGIARVGDSPEEYVLGPEVPDPEPLPPGSYKDASGAIKRQAARFRIYGYNAAGEVVRELTASNADITWTVEVANRKAAWYQFQIALDIPEASFPDVQPSKLRNGAETDRTKLAIVPGSRTIRGTSTSGPEYAFDTGKFYDTDVYLGELRTDEAGRLLFLGGHGVSASKDGKPPTDFANSDGWYDDTSDGPVTANVTIDGHPIPVDPAWVAVAPPNYAPELKSIRTMYDLLIDTYVTAGWMPYPETVSFTKDVLPILQRLAGLQWVNHGFATAYGYGGTQHLLDPDMLARLSSTSTENAELRNQFWMTCRNFARDGESPVPWPWIYGDSTNFPPVSPRQHITLSPTQYTMLSQWAAGQFVDDYDPSYVPPSTLAAVPLAEQPATLDRAALEFCLADAFHPGCELTWPMRHATLYEAPFRVRRRTTPEPSYGTQLVPEIATEVDGPLYGQGPGTLTRWMAVPWQTDTASCRSGYQDVLGFGPMYDPYVPTFWPARVPNQVLSEEDYLIVVDESRPMEERQAAFERRAVWLRVLSGGYWSQITEMVTEFGRLGIVEARPGAPGFPDRILVESQVGYSLEGVPPLRNLITLHTTAPEAAAEAPPLLRGALATDLAATETPEVEVAYVGKLNRFTRRR